MHSYKYSANDAKSLSHQELKSMVCVVSPKVMAVETHPRSSANAALDLNKRLVVVDNASDGMDIYNLDTAEYMATFRIPKTSADVFPNTVAFADQSRAVVGGSDHGFVYVFDRKTGRVICRLKYAGKGGVETLAVSAHLATMTWVLIVCQVHDSRNDDCVLLAAASSTSSKATDIRLWRWKPPKESNVATTSSAMHSFRTMLIVFAIVSLAIVITIWQVCINPLYFALYLYTSRISASVWR
jgi:hypothetical protein